MSVSGGGSDASSGCGSSSSAISPMSDLMEQLRADISREFLGVSGADFGVMGTCGYPDREQKSPGPLRMGLNMGGGVYGGGVFPVRDSPCRIRGDLSRL